MPTNNAWNSTNPAGVVSGGTGLATLTAHYTMVGAGTSPVALVAPSATSGIPYISQGVAADPTFGTAVVAGGGTGATSFTAYSVICGGTTSTGALQSVSGVGSAGQILTSNGAGALPTWQTGSGGSGIVTINGNSGSVTGTTVTLTTGASNAQGTALFTGSSTTMTQTFTSTDGKNNTGLGTSTLAVPPSGIANTAFGYQSGMAITSGTSNTALGWQTLTTCTTGSNNTAIGVPALELLTTGSNNTAIGGQAGQNFTTGSNNTMLGESAGSGLRTSDSSNIDIGHFGISGDNNTIRIGTQGSSAGQQNTCFIAGITGVTVSSSAAVLINTSTGQLGTVASSLRYKENIVDIETTSEDIYKLRPVEFNFKTTKERAFGLIAEEVHEQMPSLVVYDREGKPETVKYHELPVLLINEIKKLRKEVEELKKK